ncbi:MAG: Gfo/Idh/MocA family oxidoreductase [Geminocystis sp.]|nr:Gfo/Idh/MocA family oxidoreductase [Geminocystis sp.]HIK38629.1 Gfo/Idh/MocA family oxidoreductase [Geminocystis sp. M7585_C2015_104]MCS7147693.1 Gfo/Idh/MocA family oxidoreductase [Geminocystis sp.]MCX8078464.1 Gfo/Idh/MocA family oxidoreductase [Geminocystis sp.]MDW8117248.1 Gfo/Idh/MocA family oxidoreductase [Geminocystis sp.]
MLKVGLVGTGHAAQRRAEAFLAHPLTTLVAVAGNTPEKTQSFSQTYGIPSVSSWQDLIEDTTIDLICISNVNKEHGKIVRAALLADKHVVVEYPLTIYPQEAEELLQLARSRNKLLHVEHIEILGGVHQAIRKYLSEIGEPFLARYSTITLKSRLTPNWTFNYSCYGYPFIAALSRITRFTDLFGRVDSVTCYSRFWDAPQPGYFSSCYCQAQLSFKNGILVCLTYGKGDEFKSGERVLEIYGNKGTLKFEGEKGKIIRGEEEEEIEVAGRRGLFNKDTEAVIDYLTRGKPLYFTLEASIYALKVAEAIQKADQTKSLVFLP